MIRIGPDCSIQARPCIATIGFFDGVHLGHRFLLRQVAEEAGKKGLATMVVTFPDHPRRTLHADYQPALLTTPTEKWELLAETGTDYCAWIPFTTELSKLTAREFMEHVLRDRLNVKALVIGYDHHFGHKSNETFEDYSRYGEELGIKIIQARELADSQIHISSSAIRKALLTGNADIAAQALGRPYSLQGSVVKGHQIGRTLGFPTANLHPLSPLKLIPGNGVYAVRATVDRQTTYAAMLNIGYRPTFADETCLTIEAHLLHFKGNLYGKDLQIDFITRLRGEQHFATPDELAAQLKRDALQTEKILLI